MKLYEIAEEVQAAINELEEMDLSEQEKADSLSALMSGFQDKAASVIAVLKNLSAEAAAYKAEADRLSAMAKNLTGQHDRLKSYLRHHMESIGLTQVGEGVHTANLGKASPIVVVDDAGLVPRDWCRHNPETWEPNKVELYKALKAGEEIAGCHLGYGKPKLTIK